MLNAFEIAGCKEDVEDLSTTDASNPTQGSRCWILVQQNDGEDETFFNRDWDSYSQGFGDASGNYWIGNEHLHRMTQLLNNGLKFAVYRRTNCAFDKTVFTLRKR